VAKAAKPVEMAILAPERDELKGVPGTVVTAWQIAGAAGSACELRYDDLRLREVAGDPGQLVAWLKTGKGWEPVTNRNLPAERIVVTKALPADGVLVVGFGKDGALDWAKTDAKTNFADPGPGDNEFHGPFAGWFDVTKAGAKGDGKADDTEAIQKVIDEVSLDEAKAVVYLPKGTYRITKTLLLPSPAGMKKDSQGFANKVLIGEDPANTTIVWDGPAQPYTPTLAAASPREVPELVAPVAMLHVGIAHSSTLSRLTLDGKGKIAGLRVERFGAMYSSYGRVTDMRFVDCTVGFWNSDLLKPESDMDSEYSLLRLRFQRCDIGAAIVPGNGYDYWLREALFDDCRIGVYSKSGDFRVANSVFRRSREADIIACGHRGGGVRDCVSAGSRRFFVGAGNMLFHRNLVLDPVESDAFQVFRPWGMIFLDNQVRSRPGAAGPVIHEFDPMRAADDKNDYNKAMIAVGNRFTVADPIRFRSTKTFLHDNGPAKTDAFSAKLELPTPPAPRVERQIIEVADAAQLQGAIDQAAAAAKAKPDSRPVVHLAANPGKAGSPKTVEIPGGLRFSIEGDGASSRIASPGDGKEGKDPALRLAGPSKVELSDLFFLNFQERDGAPMVEVAGVDQAGGRIWGDNLNMPVEVAGLGQTRVWLTEYMYGWVSVMGPKAAGPSFTAVLSGAGSGNSIMASVRNGGRLLATDVWSENGQEKEQKPWALAAGAGAQPGELVLESMYLHQSAGPDCPFIVSDNFAGRLSILGVSNTGTAAARGDASKTSWLDLRGESALMEGKPGKLGRFDIEGEQAAIDPKWLDEQLAFLRSVRWSAPRAPTPAGATDLRMHRLVNLIGSHGKIRIAP